MELPTCISTFCLLPLSQSHRSVASSEPISCVPGFLPPNPIRTLPLVQPVWYLPSSTLASPGAWNWCRRRLVKNNGRSTGSTLEGGPKAC